MTSCRIRFIPRKRYTLIGNYRGINLILQANPKSIRNRIFEKPKESLILNQPPEKISEPFAHANTQFDGGRQGNRSAPPNWAFPDTRTRGHSLLPPDSIPQKERDRCGHWSRATGVQSRLNRSGCYIVANSLQHRENHLEEPYKCRRIPWTSSIPDIFVYIWIPDTSSPFPSIYHKAVW